MKDLVSVIIPIYNAKKWLSICLDSVVNQTYENIEIILINDGSTDTSLSICNKYASRHKNIVVVDKKNEGVSATRNLGISIANGKYIMFVDSDDWLPRESIEILINELKNTESDFCYGKAINITLSSNKQPFKNTEKKYVDKTDLYEWYSFLRLLDWAPWGKLYKSSIIKENSLEFPLGIKSGEDSIFVTRYLNCCSNVCSIDKTVYYYNRLNERSAVLKYYSEFNKWMFIYMTEIINALYVDGCSECCKYISYFAIEIFDNICQNYAKCDNKDEALLKLRESYSMFKEYVNSNMPIPEEAKKAQKKIAFYYEFFEDNDFEKLYYKLKASNYESVSESCIKVCLKRLKSVFLILNKNRLT